MNPTPDERKQKWLANIANPYEPHWIQVFGRGGVSLGIDVEGNSVAVCIRDHSGYIRAVGNFNKHELGGALKPLTEGESDASIDKAGAQVLKT